MQNSWEFNYLYGNSDPDYDIWEDLVSDEPEEVIPVKSVESAPTKSVSVTQPTEETIQQKVVEEVVVPKNYYILNTNSMKFHYPSCGSVSRMSESNKMPIEASRDEVIAMRYDPCGKCCP